MNSHRLLGGAVASALIAAGWAGTTFSQVAAQSAYDQVSFSPNPIAAAATLTSGESVTVCVQAKADGTVETGESVDLSFATNDVPPGDTGTGGSAAVGITTLTGTPASFAANTNCTPTGSAVQEHNAVSLTYTAPADGGPNNGTPYPVWGGRDIITGTDPDNSSVTSTAVYEFSPVTGYSFSTGSSIASNASLTTGQQVSFTVEALNGTTPVPGAAVLLWLSTKASPGGSVTAAGAGPPSGDFCTTGEPATLTSQSPSVTPVRCITNTSGQVNLTYTASSATSTVGIDTVTAQNHPTTFFSASTSYGYQAAGAYTALQPFRICDTRSGTSTECSTDGPLNQGATMTFQVTGVDVNSESVPSDAQAVVLNVTAVSGTAATFLTAFPAGNAVPTASNINVNAAVNQANLVVVTLGNGGKVSIYNSLGSINVVADVQGYFAAPTTSPTPGQFHSIPPLRICDTRSGMGTACSGSALAQGAWTKVVVSGCPTGNPSCTASVPSDGTAAAVALNLTAVSGTSDTYLSVVPPNGSNACPTTTPAFSNLNVDAATNLANRVIVPLGPDQDVCVYNSLGSINYILDINGWFGNGTESTQGALFYATPPTRICDTRSEAEVGYTTECTGKTLSQGGTLNIPVAGVDGLPASPVAVIANVTAVSGTSFTYFTLYPADVSLPNASDLNVNAQQNLPNLAIVQVPTSGTGDGEIDLFNDLGTINAVVDVSGWFQ
jgi:hypothetical protein